MTQPRTFNKLHIQVPKATLKAVEANVITRIGNLDYKYCEEHFIQYRSIRKVKINKYVERVLCLIYIVRGDPSNKRRSIQFCLESLKGRAKEK